MQLLLLKHFEILTNKFCEYCFNLDIDECESGQHECPDEAVCVNSVGGYQCICKPGYDSAGTAKDGTARCVKKGKV